MIDAPTSTARRRRARPWRDNIEALTLALVIAVLFKYFLVEAYKIPSGSMQPTLMGIEGRAGGGLFDRVLVDKLAYHYRDPERWEVVVFRYPLDRSRVFVKRIVGLPGEELMLRGGDVWRREGESWQVLRKPAGAQRSLWLEVPARDRWSLGLSYDTWSHDGRSLVATAAGEATFPGDAQGVTDVAAHGYPDEILERYGHPRRAGGTNDVGDLKLEARVSAGAATRRVTLEIREGPRVYRAELAGPEAAPAPPRVSFLGGALLAEGATAFVLDAGRPHAIAFQNLDDELALFVDDVLVARLDVPEGEGGAASLRLATDGPARFEDVRVWRDVYYTTSGGARQRWTVPPESFVMLGDNTLDSADSREWELTRVHLVDGPQAGEAFAGAHVPDENPTPLAGGQFGDEVALIDEWGQRRVFRGSHAHSRIVPAPFVPAALVQGRVLAVFWPIAPWAGIVRARWVR